MGEIFVPEIAEFAGGGGIVCAIEVDGRMLGDFFEATGPADICDALLDGSPIDGEAALGQDACGCSGGESIADLKFAGERQIQIHDGIIAEPFGADAIEAIVRAQFGNFPEAIEFEEAGTLLFAALRDHGAGFDSVRRRR